MTFVASRRGGLVAGVASVTAELLPGGSLGIGVRPIETFNPSYDNHCDSGTGQREARLVRCIMALV
jgi:hypothetical protein